jgi:alkylation response protein AidB-like acyl-CoA dehydrogenase
MVDLIPDDDQRELVDTAGAFLGREMGRDRLRTMVGSGISFDRGFLRRCGELGWFGISLDANAGGAGLSAVEEALVFRELGRYLVPGPFLATLLAAGMAAASGRSRLSGELARGELVAGLAEAVPGDDRLVVWDIEGVDVLLAVDADAGWARLLDATQVRLNDPVPSIDPTVTMAYTQGWAVPEALASTDRVAELVNHGVVLVAAMLCGIAEQVRDDSAAYARERVQFNRPIGAFQAVKHRCADMALRAEAAWAQTAVAALRFAAAGTNAAFDVAASKIVATDAAVRNSRDNIQNHGGIGFTAEHDAHLFLKRAHVLEHVLGSSRRHLRTTLECEVGW